MPTANLKRYRLYIEGTVQGVGFRPFVHNLASKLGLSGFIRNEGGNVVVEAEGTQELLHNLVELIRNNAPPLVRSLDIHVEESRPTGELGFRIEPSSAIDDGAPHLVPPDTAACNDCLAELFDPGDRRFRYPFINCTNCGPRFTIINELPYDRCRTTMRSFTMCRECAAEYDDPGSRRFHAQPNACPVCGPQLTLITNYASQTARSSEDVLKRTLELLADGMIVAIKGLGGFHLVCDALNGVAVERLRKRKHRYQKPLAVMFSSLDAIKEYGAPTKTDETSLLSPERPIVIIDCSIAKLKLPDSVAPGLNQIGAYLPYTPLQEILLRDYGKPLIMTSANLSDEPICIQEEECFARLKDIADAFLVHDRPIAARYDDSVVSSVNNRTIIMRRARGLAPSTIIVPVHSTKTILAVGPHLKNTFCLLRGNQAYLGQHIGDLDDALTLEHFEEALGSYQKLFNLRPDVIACDLHPDYLSTTIALEHGDRLGIPVRPIQHHHAHIASCMAEHGLKEKVIGVAFDGIGYGTDGTAWGGEFLLADFESFQRVAHLATVPMPGGEAAVKEPWRMALAYGVSTIDIQETIDAGAYEFVTQQLEKRINSPITSSCGRLFDAVSSLIGLCHRADYEGHAAMMLEALAWEGRSLELYPYSKTPDEQNVIILSFSETLACIKNDLVNHVDRAEIAWKFHTTIANLVVETCTSIKEATGIRTICLSGGVFQNRLLTGLILDHPDAHEFEIFFHERVPTNDGGISLGQAVIAATSECRLEAGAPITVN